MSQCKAMSKRSGERCRKRSSKGLNVCSMHGGKSLRGVDSPRFKTGRYSKYLPDRLAEKAAGAAQCPTLYQSTRHGVTRDRRDRLAALREDRVERKAKLSPHGDLPENRVAAVGQIQQLEVARTNLVRHRPRRGEGDENR